MKTKNKIFTSLAVLGSTIFAMVLTAASGAFEALGIFKTTTGTSTDYSITLDKSNAYSSGTSKEILTAFGKNPITFSYSGCSSLNEGHAVISENGTIGNYWTSSSDTFNNKLSSITSFTPTFTAQAGASLQFRASYDGKSTGSWGEFAPLTSGESFSLTSKPYYVELKAVGGAVNLTSCKIDYLCQLNDDPSGTPLYETGTTANGGEKRTYSTESIFDDLIGGSTKRAEVTMSNSFEVFVTLSDGKSTRKLNKGEFTYKVNNPSGVQIDTGKKFGSTIGIYTAYIKPTNLPEISVQFEVKPQLVENISIPEEMDMKTGADSSISATVSPATASDKSVTWSSSNDDVATINSSTGAIHALSAGTTIITATANDGSDIESNECELTVTDIAVTSVTLDEHSLMLYTDDDDVALTATVKPDNATVKTVNWSSSDPSVATVSSGVVHPVGPGTAVITATSGSASDTCSVEVKDASEKPKIEEAKYTGTGTNFSPCVINYPAEVKLADGVKIGTTKAGGDFTVTVPVGATKLFIYIASWKGTSNVSLGISPTNKVSTTSITVNSNSGIANSSPFTLSEGSDPEDPLKDYLIEIPLVNITEETNIKFTSESYRCVSWSPTCLVSGGGSTETKVTNISLSPSSSTLTVNDTCQLTATVLPDNATNKNVTWSSNDNGVATVSDSGLVTAVGPGDCTITATAQDGSGVNGTVSISVSSGTVAVTGITLDKTTATIAKGDSLQLKATISPSNATDQGVTWSGSANGITVNTSGFVSVSASATEGATATIVATAHGNTSKTASCVVTVKNSGGGGGGGTYQLVESAADLVAGNKYVIASKAKGTTAGNIDGAIMSVVNSTFSNDGKTITSLGKDTVELTLGGETGAWTFANTNGNLLGATAVKKLAWGSGTTTWSISINSDDKNATIQNTTESYGRFLYNATAGQERFTTYTSATNASMLLPQLYYVSGTPVPAETVDLDKTSLELAPGSSSQLTPIYGPPGANTDKEVSWESDNENVATVSNGLVQVKTTAEDGQTATITCTLESTGDTATCSITVRKVLVSNVTVSPSTKEISIGGTVELSATITPSSAYDKSVTWSTNNSGVASVSSTGVVTGVSAGTATITATANDGSGKKGTASITVSQIIEPEDDWTVLLYMCGADLESESGCATEDLQEIASVSGQTDKVNIVVEAGGANSWKSTYSGTNKPITANKLSRFHLQNRNYVSDEKITYQSMGNPDTLKSFINWGLENFPAKKTALIFWNHGGALEGCCYDERVEEYDDEGYITYSDPLTPADMNTAITESNLDKNFEFIGYDCCLMQCHDIAEYNSHYANYMIGSQESEWGFGWSYDKWIGYLYNSNKTTEDVLKQIVDSYHEDTEDSYEYYYDEPNNQTLSYFSFANWNSYRTSFNNFTSAVSSALNNSSISWSDITNGINKGLKYGYSSNLSGWNGGYVYDIFDIGGAIAGLKTINKIKNNSTLMTAINNWENAFDGLNIYEQHGSAAAGSYGLCMYCPVAGYYSKDEMPKENSGFSSWMNLCHSKGEYY